MKRVTAILLAVLAVASLSAQDKEIKLPPLTPRDAETMGMGGSFVSVSNGWKSIYSNPAGYADKRLNLGIDANAWVYLRPTKANLDYIQAQASDPLKLANYLIPNGGAGAGAAAELGIVGSGLAIAGYAITDNYISGTSLVGANGKVEAETGIVLGLGLPINLFGLKFAFGGDIRPNYRISNNINYDLIVGIMSSLTDKNAQFDPMKLPVKYGLAFALDFGGKVTVGPFDLAIAFRNLSLSADFYSGTFQDALDYISSSKKVTAVVTSKSYPDIAIGATFHPEMGALKALLDPKVHVELRDPIPVFEGTKTPWTLLHFGAEARILSILLARAGINGGNFSLGGGVDLYIMKVEAAVFTEELGKYIGDKKRSGLAVSVKVGL